MSRKSEGLLDFMLRRPDFKWGDLPSSNAAVRELGIEGAIAEKRQKSRRRSSSGQTSEIQRVGGRKARQEHYKRKAILEAEKEAERRAIWIRRHPGAHESNWTRRQEKRRRRRAASRSARRQTKKHRTTAPPP